MPAPAPLSPTPAKDVFYVPDVQHPYECQCKGHEGGRTFYAAPPEWYAAKNLTTPKSCPPCREWIKGQADETRICACGAKIRVSARAKISHFKRVGPYEPVSECRPCRDGNRPSKGVEKRPSKEKRRKEKEEEKPAEFSTLAFGVPLQPRPLVTTGRYYDTMLSSGETRKEHIGRHVPGSIYDMTTEDAATANGLPRPKSPSAFASDPHVDSLLETAQYHLSSADTSSVREYEDHGRIIRVTRLNGHDRLEISILRELSAGSYGLVTTYDNVTVQDVKDQTWYNGSRN